MQIKFTFVSILTILLLAGCQNEPKFIMDENAKNQFARLPGKIGITLETNAAKWHRVLDHGTLAKVSVLPAASKEAAAIGIGWFYGATGLPEYSGYDYRGPYMASPDTRFVAASMAVSGPSTPGPTEVVIVDTRAKRIISKVGKTDERHIDGLAWSRDSRLVAVLKNSSRYGRGPLDMFGGLFGHPVPYMTYYLEVVDLNGKVIASTKLVSDLRASWGEVVWIE